MAWKLGSQWLIVEKSHITAQCADMNLTLRWLTRKKIATINVSYISRKAALRTIYEALCGIIKMRLTSQRKIN